MSESDTIDALLMKLKEFNKCDNEELEDLCKKTLRLLPPSDPSWFAKTKDTIMSRFNKPLTMKYIADKQDSAITWATKAYEWSKKSNVGLEGIEGPRERIEIIKTEQEDYVKKFKEETKNDTSVYNEKQPIYEKLLVSMNIVNNALSFVTALNIIKSIRQTPEGMSAYIDVVDPLVLPAFIYLIMIHEESKKQKDVVPEKSESESESESKPDTTDPLPLSLATKFNQNGGTSNQDETLIYDLYDVAVKLLTLNGDLIEEKANQSTDEENKSRLTNTLTILMNTKLPGKRHLLYKPQMTIPNTRSSQVCFDPRIKLKQSIVNNVQPLPPDMRQPSLYNNQYPLQNRYQMSPGMRQSSLYNNQYPLQNRDQMPYGYQPQANSLYPTQMQQRRLVQSGGLVDPLRKTEESSKPMEEICSQFFNRNEFNGLLLRTINANPQTILDLTTAKEMGVTDNNIQVTLDTLFKSDIVIYLDGSPYTIYAFDWVIGDWQIDTRPDIKLNPMSQFQLQAPMFTLEGVIIPKNSIIAKFEAEAEKERNEIPEEVRKGDAVKSSSKIVKAMKSALSSVAQNTPPRLTSEELMKKISPWELTKLIELGLANRAYDSTQDGAPNYVGIDPANTNAAVKVSNVETSLASEAKAKVDTEVEASNKEKAQAKAKALVEAQAKAEAEAEAAAEAEAEAEAKAKAVAGSDLASVAGSDLESDAGSEIGSDLESEVGSVNPTDMISEAKGQQMIAEATKLTTDLTIAINEEEKEKSEVINSDEYKNLDKDSDAIIQDYIADIDILSSEASTPDNEAEKERLNEQLAAARVAKQEKKNRLLAGYEKAKRTRQEKQTELEEAEKRLEDNISKLPPDLRKYINDDLLNSEPKQPPIKMDIESRIHRQFKNAMITSAELGFWTLGSPNLTQSIARSLEDENKFVLKNYGEELIDAWRVDNQPQTEALTTPDQFTLDFAIQAIVKNSKELTTSRQDVVATIDTLFTNQPNLSDSEKIFECEKICNIKFILLEPSYDINNKDFPLILNQRVEIETATDDKTNRVNIGGVRQLASTKMKGVIVSINDEKTNFQVLTDTYEIKECETKNAMLLSDTRKTAKLIVNEIRITRVDGFVVANIPNSDTYNSDALRKQLNQYTDYAFIIKYTDSAGSQPKYKAMYYYRKNPARDAEYIFKLSDTKQVSSYLMYMMFLASYHFVEPTPTPPDNKQVNFALNSESPYNIMTKLNSTSQDKSSIIRMASYYVTKLEGEKLISSNDKKKLFTELKTINKSKLFLKLAEFPHPNRTIPFVGGGSLKHLQKGGGWTELVEDIKTNNLKSLAKELKQDVLLINKQDNDPDKNTLLMIACQTTKKDASLDVVKLLLEMGAQGSINAQNVVGNTALHYACENNLKNIAQLLVANGADLTIKNLVGKTPIDVCTDPMLKSIFKRHVENVKNMFRFVENNRKKDVLTLLKTFRNLNIVNSTTGNTPLHIACQLGNQDIAELLLQYGADPNILNNAGKTPFNLIAVKNVTLQADLENQSKKTTEFLKAVADKDLDSMKKILGGLGTDKKLKEQIINSRNNFKLGGQTPLIIATMANADKIVEYLLKNGADVDASDKYETTPLHYACKEGNESIALTLVRAGANLDAEDMGRFDGKTYVRYTPLNLCKTNELRFEILKTYFEKLASDKKLKFPKGLYKDTPTEESIKKALSYYIRNPNKLESKNSYYVVIDVDLYPGTSISKAQKARMRCASSWENVREASADFLGKEYVPKEFTIKSLVPEPAVVAKRAPYTRRSSSSRRSRRGGQAKKTRKRGKHGA
jgi:ankyrin repeat protein